MTFLCWTVGVSFAGGKSEIAWGLARQLQAVVPPSPGPQCGRPARPAQEQRKAVEEGREQEYVVDNTFLNAQAPALPVIACAVQSSDNNPPIAKTPRTHCSTDDT